MKKMRQILATATAAAMLTGAMMILPAPASAAAAPSQTQTWTWKSGNTTWTVRKVWTTYTNWCWQRPVTTAPRTPAPKPTPTPTPAPAPKPTPTPAPATSGLTAAEQQMVNLVNQERQSAGLKPLTVDMGLAKVARAKATDMVAKNYFDHTSPTYGSPFDMMRQFGVSYRTAGENLAGNQTVTAAHAALMKSPGHRANILSPNYTRIGIGIKSGSQYGNIYVQEFAG